jgi:hypothetical protein
MTMPDYFWAARGSGYGFFGVATRYHLKLYPLPKAIQSVSYYYSLSVTDTVAEWLGNNGSKLSPAVELSVFLLIAPAGVKRQDCRGQWQALHGFTDCIC